MSPREREKKSERETTVQTRRIKIRKQTNKKQILKPCPQGVWTMVSEILVYLVFAFFFVCACVVFWGALLGCLVRFGSSCLFLCRNFGKISRKLSKFSDNAENSEIFGNITCRSPVWKGLIPNSSESYPL